MSDARDLHPQPLSGFFLNHSRPGGNGHLAHTPLFIGRIGLISSNASGILDTGWLEPYLAHRKRERISTIPALGVPRSTSRQRIGMRRGRRFGIMTTSAVDQRGGRSQMLGRCRAARGRRLKSRTVGWDPIAIARIFPPGGGLPPGELLLSRFQRYIEIQSADRKKPLIGACSLTI